MLEIRIKVSGGTDHVLEIGDNDPEQVFSELLAGRRTGLLDGWVQVRPSNDSQTGVAVRGSDIVEVSLVDADKIGADRFRES